MSANYCLQACTIGGVRISNTCGTRSVSSLGYRVARGRFLCACLCRHFRFQSSNNTRLRYNNLRPSATIYDTATPY